MFATDKEAFDVNDYEVYLSSQILQKSYQGGSIHQQCQ